MGAEVRRKELECLFGIRIEGASSTLVIITQFYAVLVTAALSKHSWELNRVERSWGLTTDLLNGFDITI